MSRWRAEVRARAGDFTLDVALEGDARPLALVGPNGSGKTTLLRVLAGAVRPEAAEIEVDGVVLHSTARGVEVPIEQRRVGYVPQGYGLFPHLSVLDNVAFGLSTGARRVDRRARRGRAAAVLERLGVGGLARRTPGGLSGGEQQRVALARALVIEPALLLLDEPLAALDATARRAIRGFLAEHLRAFGRPCVIVTHDVRDVAALDLQVCVLEGGRVMQRGDLNALRAAPATDFVAEFVGLAPPI
ncbi:MAG: ABC transporter ATP-binding protein [Myxococcales bacterium]|nr:ABC transporter ATP-binding protein [Myxococcales bacterium]